MGNFVFHYLRCTLIYRPLSYPFKFLNHSMFSKVDLAVGSFGGLVKLFGTGYLKRKYVTEIALDEVDTLLDDTFKVC